MELYGAGLERLTEIVAAKGDGRPGDPWTSWAAMSWWATCWQPTGCIRWIWRHVCGGRWRSLRTRLRSQGSVDLLGIDEGVIRLRLRSSGSGCGSSAGSLKSAVEDAMYEAAPDLVQLADRGG